VFAHGAKDRWVGRRGTSGTDVFGDDGADLGSHWTVRIYNKRFPFTPGGDGWLVGQERAGSEMFVV